MSVYGYWYLDPVHGRWLNRDPIGERGGYHLYGFIENDGIIRYDHLGLFPPDTVWDARNNVGFDENQRPRGGRLEGQEPPRAPFILNDHVNTDPNATSAKKDFEQWLMANYAKSIAEGKASIKTDVDAAVQKLCFGKGNTGPKQSFGVGPKTQRRNGEHPGAISYILHIGSFSLYSRNIQITWNEDDCSYTWSGEIYAEEVAGATQGQNICNDVAHSTGFFYERTIEVASWEVSGSGKCPRPFQ